MVDDEETIAKKESSNKCVLVVRDMNGRVIASVAPPKIEMISFVQFS